MGILANLLGTILSAAFDPDSAAAQRLDRNVEHRAAEWERKMEQAQRDYNSGRISFSQYSQITSAGLDYLAKSANYSSARINQLRSKYNR